MGSPRYGACAAAAQRRTAESIADLRQIVSRVNPTELRDKRLQRLQQPPAVPFERLWATAFSVSQSAENLVR